VTTGLFTDRLAHLSLDDILAWCALSDARAVLAVALAANRSRADRRPVSVEEVSLAESR
jgi:hypothetical protein